MQVVQRQMDEPRVTDTLDCEVIEVVLGARANPMTWPRTTRGTVNGGKSD